MDNVLIQNKKHQPFKLFNFSALLPHPPAISPSLPSSSTCAATSDIQGGFLHSNN